MKKYRYIHVEEQVISSLQIKATDVNLKLINSWVKDMTKGNCEVLLWTSDIKKFTTNSIGGIRLRTKNDTIEVYTPGHDEIQEIKLLQPEDIF